MAAPLRIANSPDRYRGVPLYRSGETWLYRVSTVRGHVRDFLIRASDESVHGPFLGLDACDAYIRENGGGYLDWGRSANMVPHAPVGQMALLHKANGLDWWDYLRCEQSPRAYPNCGHESRVDTH